MRGITDGIEEVKRINLTISGAMHLQLDAIAKESDLKILDAIREAISDWMEAKKRKLMKEGYLARSKEDLNMMEEFKHLDNEVW